MFPNMTCFPIYNISYIEDDSNSVFLNISIFLNRKVAKNRKDPIIAALNVLK